jgi:hypothetical protein
MDRYTRKGVWEKVLKATLRRCLDLFCLLPDGGNLLHALWINYFSKVLKKVQNKAKKQNKKQNLKKQK